MLFIKLILVGACCLNVLQCKTLQRPHIVVIVADDLGWNDVSFHGSLQIPTPNIDTLAAHGVVLNNYYVSPLCTPSRGALMTGKHPIHLGLQHDTISADEPWGMGIEEVTLAEHLQKLGYVTHGVGKWHLGFFKKEYTPTYRGFQSFFGYWAGKGDYFSHCEQTETEMGLDLHDNNENAWGYTDVYSTELFTKKASTIIKEHNTTKSLFLYVAHQAVHGANSYSLLQAPEKYVRKFPYIKDHDRRVFAGMVSALDDSVGDIFEALSEAKMLDNLILVFTTDNGAAVEGIDGSTGSNWPLRGSKYTLWEGGVRGVAFLWSPLLGKRNHVAQQMMHISDWLPTLFAAAGGNAKELRQGTDSFNLWHPLLNNTPSPRKEVLHNIDPILGLEAIRRQQYKLVNGTIFDGNFDGWFDKSGKRECNESEEPHELREPYFEALRLSKVEKVLKNKYRSSGQLPMMDYRLKLEIQCGEKPKNASDNCNPVDAPCLFDIENDPCEYNNIADQLPEVVEELLDALNEYKLQAENPRNKKGDPSANPKYHGYAWVSWRS